MGIEVDNYYACEIDKYAIAVSQSKYPDIIRLGDVKNVKACDLPQIDLIIAGSPCQGFSVNGDMRGFDDPRSQLFWHFVRLVEECKPTWFLLENVRMKKEWADIISEAVGCEPILLNSALVSAQRRMRYYWTNIPYDGEPADRGLVLKDILEKPIADEQPMTDQQGKAYCLTASYSKCGNAETGATYESEIIHNTARHQRTCVQVVGHTDTSGSYLQVRRVYGVEGKSCTLLTIAPKVEIRTPIDKSAQSGTKMLGRANISNFTTTERVYSADHKSPCVSTTSPPKVGEDVAELTALNSTNVKLDRMRIIKREHWRMLTPIECERLQTLPDDYTSVICKSQRYKCLGNCWTVDMIVHLMNGMR
jgi:DNA (cytosine-5)-methyltransferase 3A